MDINDQKYNRYALVREMLETPEIIRNFDPGLTHLFAKRAKTKKGAEAPSPARAAAGFSLLNVLSVHYIRPDHSCM